jgi:hypothetical protein
MKTFWTKRDDEFQIKTANGETQDKVVELHSQDLGSAVCGKGQDRAGRDQDPKPTLKKAESISILKDIVKMVEIRCKLLLALRSGKGST